MRKLSTTMRVRRTAAWAHQWLVLAVGILALAVSVTRAADPLPAAPAPAPAAAAPAEVSFAVLADPRSQGDTWKNALQAIRQRDTAAPAGTPGTAFVIVAGDMDPLKARYADYQQVFADAATRPAFLAVIGNHEFEDQGEHFQYARDVVVPALAGAVRHTPTACDYVYDRGNVRVIVVDVYTELGKDGTINAAGLAWVEQNIKDAPPVIAHIFITFHEPAFPRFRHIKDSFDADPVRRNAFWQMLLQHRDKVRAVLVGHTHSYYRMRVSDPASPAASDPAVFPDDPDGIYQIDAGAAGNGPLNTVVLIHTLGPQVTFTVLQAKAGADQPFKQVDTWQLEAKPAAR